MDKLFHSCFIRLIIHETRMPPLHNSGTFSHQSVLDPRRKQSNLRRSSYPAKTGSIFSGPVEGSASASQHIFSAAPPSLTPARRRGVLLVRCQRWLIFALMWACMDNREQSFRRCQFQSSEQSYSDENKSVPIVPSFLGEFISVVWTVVIVV